GKVLPTTPTPSDARVSAREGSREAFTGESTGQVLSCETGLIPGCRSPSVEEKATSSHDVLACMGRTSRSRRPCARGEVLCAEPGRSHPCPDSCRAGSGRQMPHAEHAREAPNKGRQLPAEVVEGRASPEGNSRQAAVVRTLSRVTTSIRLAAVRRTAGGFTPRAPTSDPREGPGALAGPA